MSWRVNIGRMADAGAWDDDDEYAMGWHWKLPTENIVMEELDGGVILAGMVIAGCAGSHIRTAEDKDALLPGPTELCFSTLGFAAACSRRHH